MAIAEECVAEEAVADFSAEQVREWRQQVTVQRIQLFRKNWKNTRDLLALRSREQEEAFRYIIEWYEEFSDVVGRQKRRERLDKLIQLGLDVNNTPDHVRV